MLAKELLVIAVLIPIINFLSPSKTLGQSAPKDSVTLYLRWKHQFQFAGYYIAVEKGYYHEAGIHVNIREFDGKNNVRSTLTGGGAQYGSELGGLILSDPANSKLSVLGTVYQRSPVILLTVDRSIESLTDLAGKRVMGLTEVRAMLKSAGMIDKVNFVKGFTDLESLLSGEFDAIGAHIADQPRRLEKMGIPYKIFRPEDYAIGFYGECLITTREEVENHPKRVDKILKASMQGWKYAMAHPEEVVELIIDKYNPALRKDDLLFQHRVQKNLIMPGFFEIGSMNPDRWMMMSNVLMGLGLLPDDFEIEGLIYERDDTHWLERWSWFILTGVGVAVLGSGALLLFNFKLRKAVATQTESLKKINSELDNFVYSLSHDIRAPLASIQGLINLYQVAPLEREECMHRIENSVRRLDQFLLEIVDHSKNIRMAIEPIEIDIESLIEQVYEELRYQKGAERVKLVKELDVQAKVVTDKRRMIVLLRNFMSNSIRYRRAKVEEPFVKVSFHATRNQLVLKVSDNGQGIPTDHLDKIYNMFYRANESENGSGLGLYIVKETVEGMKGYISVRSIIEEGTEFKVTLPNYTF